MSKGIVLGLIPARGGSKGVPGKNLREVGGQPLIARAIACGLACPSIDQVVVSTDSKQIAAVAREHGATVPFPRPAELAGDTAPMLPVMQHAITACEEHFGATVEVLALLDCTAPLRRVEDVEAALQLLAEPDCDAVISGSPSHRSPYFNMVREAGSYVELFAQTPGEVGRRQDAPPVYDLNTVIWAYKRAALMEQASRLPARTRLYEVPRERAVDLDSELDFLLLEAILAQEEGKA
ncbi:MAG: acylneuraminate cytidylyltransferase family protein [Desulfarculaceae bacterium]|nr:acylneuraminate cytidylyltransferase family protein [Desulfarculaceae bacterium]